MMTPNSPIALPKISITKIWRHLRIIKTDRIVINKFFPGEYWTKLFQVLSLNGIFVIGSRTPD